MSSDAATKGCVCTTECRLLKDDCSPLSENCPSKDSSVLQKANDEYRAAGTIANEMWHAFFLLVGNGGASRSRVEHIMEFCRAMGYEKIGLAGCARYLDVMSLSARLFRSYGFQSIYYGCKIANNRFLDIGIDSDSPWVLCNPLGQAMMLNNWGSDLNVQFGLCMGHDLIFNSYSDAPVTVLVVKEKISDDCPVTTLKAIEEGKYKTNPYLVGEG